MLEEAQRQMNAALRPDDDDPNLDVAEIDHLEVTEDPNSTGPTGETDADTNNVHESLWKDKKLRPLKAVESVALMMKLATKMMKDHGHIDWEILEKKYNYAVGLERKNATSIDEQKKYVFANQSQLRSAYDELSLAAVQKQMMGSLLMEECKILRRKLMSNEGHNFPPARPRIVPASVCSSSSSACSGMSPGSTHVATTDVSVGDWTQYPVCILTKVCKLREGQKWTKELLQQRLDVLHRVRWCLCCGEVCQVRSDRNTKWSDAEIIGDCHRKNTVMRNNGSAYPECNKTGVWESVKYTPQMKDIRRNEIRKLQREFAKRVASASGQRKKKSKKLK